MCATVAPRAAGSCSLQGPGGGGGGRGRRGAAGSSGRSEAAAAPAARRPGGGGSGGGGGGGRPGQPPCCLPTSLRPPIRGSQRDRPELRTLFPSSLRPAPQNPTQVRPGVGAGGKFQQSLPIFLVTLGVFISVEKLIHLWWWDATNSLASQSLLVRTARGRPARLPKRSSTTVFHVFRVKMVVGWMEAVFPSVDTFTSLFAGCFPPRCRGASGAGRAAR